MHSIIKLYDIDNNMITFYRLKVKKSSTALKKLAEFYKQNINNFIGEQLKKTDRIVINYTEYESTKENETANISINEFLQLLNSL